MPSPYRPPFPLPDMSSAQRWRGGNADAATPAALAAEQEREHDLFRQVLEDARKPDTPLRDLFAGLTRLGTPGRPEEEYRKAAERCAEEALQWQDSLDEEGNPRWISLTLLERRSEEKGIRAGSVLPDEKESAAPKDRLRKDQGPDAPIPKRENFLFSSLEFIVRRFRKDSEEERPNPDDLYRGKGTIPPLRPQPMRSFFRMLLVTACLGVIYHVLSKKGWVPKLF